MKLLVKQTTVQVIVTEVDDHLVVHDNDGSIYKTMLLMGILNNRLERNGGTFETIETTVEETELTCS